jgi:hypothetical protein
MSLPPPYVRLAFGGSGETLNTGIGPSRAHLPRPSLLVSYVYLEQFMRGQPYCYREWVMDSGAFSAHNSGTDINLQSYIDTCKRMRDMGIGLTEIFALDVIGDWRAGLRNCDEMRRQGIDAIPTYHVGEPEAVLRGMARDYPKLALGGAVRYRKRDAWAQQCFARVWPAKIHGLGFGSKSSVLALPWHSTDATTWIMAPMKFGRWEAYGTMPSRGAKYNIRCQVDWYLDIERQARERWRREMAELGCTGGTQ